MARCSKKATKKTLRRPPSKSESSTKEKTEKLDDASILEHRDFAITHTVTESTRYKKGKIKATRTERWTLYRYLGNDAHLVVPNYITNIAPGAFNNCKSIISVHIPKSVESIGSYAFTGCENLESIYVSDPMQNITVAHVYGCENLKTLHIAGKGEYTVSLEKKESWQSLKHCLIGFKM